MIKPDNSKKQKTILIAEDEEVILKLIASILALANYQVATASSSEEALNQAQAAEQHPDLLIADVQMPGMSGVKLAKKIKALYPKIKLLFMSGQSSHVISDHALPAADVYFIPKPFRPMELLTLVKEILTAD
jgi:two-component system sensor histidine kinase EvgS